jgi:hypothetical protein
LAPKTDGGGPKAARRPPNDPHSTSATPDEPPTIRQILRAADAAQERRRAAKAADAYLARERSRTGSWFVLLNGLRHGPFEFATLTKAVADGIITFETSVSQRGWEKWCPAREVLGLTERQREEEPERREAEPRPPARARLAEAASPAPSLTPDGRLDAGPNQVYDAPTVNDDLPTLPLRQRNLIKTILAGLPRQTPAQLKVSLSNYEEELKARGVRPILGLLNDMAAIIEEDVGAPDARREWLEPGMLKAFERFADNHVLFVKQFPLDQKREELYQTTFVDEDKATGRALSKPFEDVAKATLDANRAGLTTDDFLKIVDKLTEFAKITSAQPPISLSVSLQRDDRASRTSALSRAAEPDENTNAHGAIPVTLKKRILLSGFGFFERVINLLASTATLAGPAEGNALLTALRNALAALSKLISL